jgi:hypothetical protein
MSTLTTWTNTPGTPNYIGDMPEAALAENVHYWQTDGEQMSPVQAAANRKALYAEMVRRYGTQAVQAIDVSVGDIIALSRGYAAVTKITNGGGSIDTFRTDSAAYRTVMVHPRTTIDVVRNYR